MVEVDRSIDWRGNVAGRVGREGHERRRRGLLGGRSAARATRCGRWLTLDVEVQPPARPRGSVPRTTGGDQYDAREYAAREGSDGKWRDFWRALLVLIDDALEGSDGSSRGRF